jgi:iron(III) transport system permease protein
MTSSSFTLPRVSVVAITALVILTPLSLIFWQSFLNAPFFNPAKHLSFDAYRFIFEDPDFWQSFLNSVVIATGMVLIALPLGAALAFLLTRTDLPAQRWIEVMVLIPVFISPMVLAFGYVVAMGPVGFYSLWAKDIVGDVPWNVYSLASIAVIAGLTHVPHVYLYSSAALKSLGSDVEEAARVVGANPLRVALNVSLPMTAPALFYAAVLVFFLGFELFGLPLVLGDPEGHLVLSTYLYKLTNTSWRRWRCASSR